MCVLGLGHGLQLDDIPVRSNDLSAVMPGLVPGIHEKQKKAWMAGTRPSAGPAMTPCVV
jgi:hypothetical protein